MQRLGQLLVPSFLLFRTDVIGVIVGAIIGISLSPISKGQTMVGGAVARPTATMYSEEHRMTAKATSSMVECRSCRGMGACKRCIGTGHDPVFGYGRKCILCNGSGVCPRCKGSGRRTSQHR